MSFEWRHIRNKYDPTGDLGRPALDTLSIIRDLWAINYVKDEKWFGVCVVGSHRTLLGGTCTLISCSIGKTSKIKSYSTLQHMVEVLLGFSLSPAGLSS